MSPEITDDLRKKIEALLASTNKTLRPTHETGRTCRFISYGDASVWFAGRVTPMAPMPFAEARIVTQPR